MTPERWQQVRNLLEKVLELEPTQRGSLLDQACASDPSLRNEVEALLEAGKEGLSSFLESSPMTRDALIAERDAFDSCGQLHAGQLSMSLLFNKRK